MFLSVIQIALISVFALTAVLYFGLIGAFQVWKRLITERDSDGIRFYKPGAWTSRYHRTTEVADRILGPVMLIWIASVSLGIWLLIRVVLSFVG